MSFYRKVVWYCKGLREYTRSGYEAAAKHFDAKDLDVQLDGKTFLVTGANSGLGKAAALELAKRGGDVHMVCRNPKSAEEARREVEEAGAGGPGTVKVHILDISQADAVSKFAEEFVADSNRSLDCLINNAGCMVNERKTTPGGLEVNFATNTVGTHLLTQGLMPALVRARGRVVTVSSGGMLTVRLDVDDLNHEGMNPFDGTMVYAQNKRQQVVMNRKYAAKYADVFFAAMHPGWADTPAVRSSMPDFYAKMKDKLRTVEQGADTIVWLAASEAVRRDNDSGLFYQDRKAVSEHLPLSRSGSKAGDEDRLMEILDGYVKQFS